MGKHYHMQSGFGLNELNRKNISYVLKFNFPASNNKVEYEVSIAGLELARELSVKQIEIYSEFPTDCKPSSWGILSEKREHDSLFG